MIGTLKRSGVIAGQFQKERRRATTRPWWMRSYAVLLGALAMAYVAGYGALLAATDGLPYVLDNNESFSSLVHAMNLYDFGLSKSFGLTDEAYGPNPDAHPYVHSHQGNFPRVYSLLIYVLGARTIESQIIVTTFTVGALAAFLAYYVFSRLAGPALALVATLVLLSDYIHVAQWHVNTYRVWHFFLLFSSLACAYGVGGRWRRTWLALTLVNAAVLFYSELISVAFTALLAWLFMVSRHWRRPRLVLASTVAQVTGGLAALLLLVAQIVGYLGWDDFVQDVWLTYQARNLGGASGELRAQIEAFYQRNNILFWQNYVDGASLRSLSSFVEIHAHEVFQVYSPLLTLVVLVLVCGWLLGLIPVGVTRWRAHRDGSSAELESRLELEGRHVHVDAYLKIGVRNLSLSAAPRLLMANRVIRFGLLAAPMWFLLFTILQDESFAGLTPAPATASVLASFASLVVALVGAGVASLLLTKVATGDWWTAERLSIGRTGIVMAFLLGIQLFIASQPSLYQQSHRPIWFDPIASIIPLWVERSALILAVGLAVAMCLFGSRRVVGPRATSQLRGLFGYLLLAGLAYVITYFLATGYVYSGYLTRSAPLAVFVFGVLVAFAACIVVAAVAHAWKSGSWLEFGAKPSPAWGSRSAGVIAAALLVWMVGYWIVLNGSYVRLFPPDHYTFLKQLSRPPLHGRSAVVNNYAGPTSVMTRNWAYYDTQFGRENPQLTDDGYVVDSDRTTYLWLADKRDNPAYLRPELFVCMRMPSFDLAARRLNSADPALDPDDCSSFPLIQRIERKRQRVVEHKLIARDLATPSAWAIVELDWDFPPYLVPLDGRQDDEIVRLVLDPAADGLRVQVFYRYAQQDGVPEQRSLIQLHASGADGRWCVVERSTTGNTFTLPASFQSTLRASVTPRSETKTGAERFSDRIVVGDGRGSPCAGR